MFRGRTMVQELAIMVPEVFYDIGNNTFKWWNEVNFFFHRHDCFLYSKFVHVRILSFVLVKFHLQETIWYRLYLILVTILSLFVQILPFHRITQPIQPSQVPSSSPTSILTLVASACSLSLILVFDSILLYIIFYLCGAFVSSVILILWG